MIEAKAIIGANFGDCGKGLATDYFAHKAVQKGHKTLVVLNNGGPQRSHTVSLSNGTRHAFRHIGSGTFTGADTYLSEFFIVNPIFFAKEYKELQTLGYNPIVYIDKKCKFTTPYEMILNQMLEESRGDKRHGSCGMGIWETIRTYNEEAWKFNWQELCEYNKEDIVLKRLERFLDQSFHFRFTGEIRDSVYIEWYDLIKNEVLYKRYIEDILFMKDHTIMCDASILSNYDEIIFENGQGLLLNDDPNNVHTTPSNTGMDNIRELEQRLGCFHTEPIYVSRTYITRHGADPFFIEDANLTSALQGKDQTNKPNLYQGTLRFGTMDNNFIRRIEKDSYDRDYSILLTHVNEMKPSDHMCNVLDSKNVMTSIGEQRESIKC